MEESRCARLIGAPPGNVGYEEGGQLQKRLRRKPYSRYFIRTKSNQHTRSFHILLQMLDEGRIYPQIRKDDSRL